MLYEALSFTQIKVIGPYLAYKSGQVSSLNSSRPTKNKTYVIPLPSLDPQPMLMNLQDFLFYVVQPYILISPRIVSPQAVVINYQNITKGPR
jgi:hypothetical protein